MSLDNIHHLEGVLVPPGTFRVYLYDEYTKPLKTDQMKLASGTIQIGDSEDAPKIPLGQEERNDGGLPGREREVSGGYYPVDAPARHAAGCETGTVQLHVRQIHGFERLRILRSPWGTCRE